MKHCFIINPVAGQGKGVKALETKIEEVFARLGGDYQILISEGYQDAKAKAHDFAQSLDGEEGRVYACGGDGTVHEVVNGIVDFENVSVGVVPLGTGNDLIRNFPDAGDFMNVEAQVKGETKKIDLIRYRGTINGEEVTEYCVNMINIGFDCNVVELAGRLKKKPLIAGSFAYLLAVFGMFIKKKGININITEIGENKLSGINVIRDGELLLCAVCNGSYCGGGIKSAPTSILNDGEFELNLISDVSRTRFLRLFPTFKKGEHLSIPGIESEIEVRKCRDAKLESNKNWEFFICVDGEIKTVTGSFRVTMMEGALNLIVPSK